MKEVSCYIVEHRKKKSSQEFYVIIEHKFPEYSSYRYLEYRMGKLYDSRGEQVSLVEFHSDQVRALRTLLVDELGLELEGLDLL